MTDIRDGHQPALRLPLDILLVYGSLRTGGIETLIVRLANFYVSLGVHVSVCCTLGGVLESLLDREVNIIRYSETNDLIRVIHARKHVSPAGSRQLIVSFDPISAARALMIETTLSHSEEISHVTGIFHPRAYFMTGERRDRVCLNYLIARAVGKNSLFFMNEECRASHSIKWNTDLDVCSILALPINRVAAKWRPSEKAIVRIVSVGRLVDFKAYNLGVSKVIRECLDRGVEVTWDIYGDGPLKCEILKEIEAHGVANDVCLMGELEYARFYATVTHYDLFVGMGTSALEAAMIGVPTICITVDESTRCYGYINSLPFGNVGERLSYPPTIELADLIQAYSACEPAQRVVLSNQSRTAAEKYSMPIFAEALANIAFGRRSRLHRVYRKLIAEFYRLMTEGYVAKFVRRLSRFTSV